VRTVIDETAAHLIDEARRGSLLLRTRSLWRSDSRGEWCGIRELMALKAIPSDPAAAFLPSFLSYFLLHQTFLLPNPTQILSLLRWRK